MHRSDTPEVNRQSAVPRRTWIAFAGDRRVAEGDPASVATALRLWLDDHPAAQPLVFDAESSSVIEVDLRGTPSDVRERLTGRPRQEGASAGEGSGAAARAESQAAEPFLSPPVWAESVAGKATGAEQPRGRGRPRLGVVPREVTLLPRHWAWLGEQPGGASVALRKLVERALRDHRDADRVRAAQESVFRFANAMAGNAPGFEDAVRALFAGDGAGFSRHSASWPPDVRAHALRLSTPAFAGLHSATAGDRS